MSTASARAAMARSRNRILSKMDHRFWRPVEIARRTNLHRETVTTHLKALAKEGLVEVERLPDEAMGNCYRKVIGA